MSPPGVTPSRAKGSGPLSALQPAWTDTCQACTSPVEDQEHLMLLLHWLAQPLQPHNLVYPGNMPWVTCVG